VFEAGGANKVGPALWGIVNKAKASDDGFAYSAALAGFGGAWDYQSLNAFLAKPKAYISGTKMNFAGLKKPEDRANMVAWLRTMADSQAPLPTPEDIAAESGS
jgi:cytochrome c